MYTPIYPQKISNVFTGQKCMSKVMRKKEGDFHEFTIQNTDRKAVI